MRRATPIAIATLLALFAIRSWNAVSDESPTYDEPAHLLAGYTALTLRDFRINTEHPILWKYWAALPDLFVGPFRVDTRNSDWEGLPKNRVLTRRFVQKTLFETPGNDTRALFARAHAMMLVIGLALGLLIAGWAWCAGDATAALIAVGFYAFDPNFLGHAPLVTNDVAMSLLYTAIMFATWRVGQEASVPRVLFLALLFGVGVLVKYSALAAGPILALLLCIRALSTEPWLFFRRTLERRGARLAAAFGVAVICLLFAWISIWSAYGFRYGVSPDPSIRLDPAVSRFYDARNALLARAPDSAPTAAEIDAQPPSRTYRLFVALESMRVLPEAYLDGLLYTASRASVRTTYLKGDRSRIGTWSYFPIAVLVKTPIGTLVSLLGVLALALTMRPWRRDWSKLWLTLCLIVPPLSLFASAMASHLNIGLRHVLPIYPFIFVSTGLASARALRQWRRSTLAGLAVCMAALIVESRIAAQDYLAFFEVGAGGERSGLYWLADSNLDWGQGLRWLAEWQRLHPQELLQVGYYGTAEPAFEGVHAETWNPHELKATGTTALGASVLQGLPNDPVLRRVVELIRTRLSPREVLGNSVYLYNSADIARIASGQ